MNLPNVLTLLRILAVPAIVALVLVGGSGARWLALILYTLAALTDYLDGYLARIMSRQTPLGRLLDPIADKVLVASVLMLLAGTGDIAGLTMVPAILILCREITVTGLREFLAERNIPMPVSQLAKWKTTLQMVAIGVLIVGEVGPAAVPVHTIGVAGLWIAAALTIVTGYSYFVAGLRQVSNANPSTAPGQGNR